MRQLWQDLPCGCHWEFADGWCYCSVARELSHQAFLVGYELDHGQKWGRTLEETQRLEADRGVKLTAFYVHMGWG